MNNISKDQNEKIVWTRQQTNDRDSVVIGRKISDEWLSSSIDVWRLQLTGDLAAVMSDLLSAAREDRKLNLPIVSLRTALIGTIEGVISVDTNLGLPGPSGKKAVSAIEMYQPFDAPYETTRVAIAEVFKQWYLNDVAAWTQRNNIETLVSRLLKAIRPECIEITPCSKPLLAPGTKRPDYALIVRDLVDRLRSEELFPGLGPCELVVKPEYPGNMLELSTAPAKAAGNEFFSMVARISVVRVPYNPGLYLRVSASRRSWADELPRPKANAPTSATAYLFRQNLPILPISMRRTKKELVELDDKVRTEWNFGEDYAPLRRQSQNSLPASLSDAVKIRPISSDEGEVKGWVGIPCTTRLYDTVRLRTVFESDEADLIRSVEERLDGFLSGPLVHIECEVTAKRKKTDITMINLQNLDHEDIVDSIDFVGGVAGQSLEIDSSIDDDIEADDGAPLIKLDSLRKQNSKAIKVIHQERVPVLFVFCDLERETKLIVQVVRVLFGDAVEVRTEKLPADTHGLRADLPKKDAGSSERFDERIKAWKVAAETVASESRPRYALICVSDKVNMRREDMLNYYADIHAMCSIGDANVHHLLPIDYRKSKDQSEQSFVHRTQSALMDVFLAHSGLVFGLQPFIKKQFPRATPKAIYGLQAMRSKARKFSGESNVSFLIVTKLVTETGVTHVRYVQQLKGGFDKTPWMSLAEGLRWLGSQRNMRGDETWLKSQFDPAMCNILSDIAAEDENAIVMLDWSTLAGLWPGARDEDLIDFAPPKLGERDLSKLFSNMAFVRIRGGDDTLTLRGVSRATYEGWRMNPTREATGERIVSEYMTTQKKIVEIAVPNAPEPKRCGHFLISMGYPKTSQGLRGLSCYRAMQRMRPLGKTKPRLFELITLEPAKKDASISATMDVTVMNCSPSTATERVAAAVMGLRLGYSHYDDWTRLPAPLFFKKKIDDYIIRYQKDESEDEDIDEGPESPGGGDTTEVKSDLFSVVSEEVLKNSNSKESNGVAGSETDLISADIEESYTTQDLTDVAALEAKQDKERSESQEDDDDVDALDDEPADWENLTLLQRAQRVPVRALYITSDLKRSRLYSAMIQQVARVVVDLPAFADRADLIETVDLSRKRDIKSFWDSQRRFGYVPKNGVKIPTATEFQDWLRRRLLTPQSLITLSSRLLFKNEWPIPKVLEIIDSYNEEASDPIRIMRATAKNLVALASWACGRKDDDALAWIIFHVAQCPGIDSGRKVIRAITEDAIGPMSQQALLYYLDCASAIDEALQQMNNIRHFETIRKSSARPVSPKSTNPIPAATPRRSQMSTAVSDVVNKVTPASPHPMLVNNPEIKNLSASAPGNTFMAIKQEIITIVASLSEDSPEFDAQITNLKAKIDTLVSLREEKLIAAAEEAERRTSLELKVRKTIEQANEVARQLSGHPELSMSAVAAQSIDPDDADDILNSIELVSSALENLASAELALGSINHEPPPKSIADRSKRAMREVEALHAVTERIDEVKAAVAACSALITQVEVPLAEIDSSTSTGSRTSMTTLNGAEDSHHANEPDGEPAQLFTDTLDPHVTAALGAAPSPDPIPNTQSQASETKLLDASAELAKQTIAAAASTSLDAFTLADHSARNIVSEEFKVARVAGDSPAVLLEEESDEDGSVDWGAAQGALIDLLDRRRYGLADVHVEAMALAFSFSKPAMKSHEVVLRAVCTTLDSIDCQFSVKTSHNEAFNQFLHSYAGSGDDLCRPLPLALGVLAASMVNMLFDESSDTRWSALGFVQQRFAGSASLDALVSHIGNLESLGMPLSRSDFLASKVGLMVAVDSEIKRIQVRASNWTHDPVIFSNWNHRGFAQMHSEMCRSSYVVAQALQHIARGENEKLLALQKDVLRRLDKPVWVLEDVQKRVKERGKPDGQLRVRFMENVTSTKKFIETYLSLLDAKSKPTNELSPSKAKFLTTLHKHLTNANDEIKAIKTLHPFEEVYRMTASKVIDGLLSLYVDERPPKCIPFDDQLLLIQVPLGRDYRPSMRSFETGEDSFCPPVCSPHEVLQQTIELANEKLLLDEAGDEGMLTALTAAARSHAYRRCFLPAYAIISRLPPGVVSQDPLLQTVHMQTQYQAARADLSAVIQNSRQRVAHALALSALHKENVRRLQHVINSIEAANTSQDFPTGKPHGSVAYPDFPHAHAALRANVLDFLDNCLEKKREALEQDLAAILEEKGSSVQGAVDRIKMMIQSKSASSLLAANDQCVMLRRDGRLPPIVAREKSVPEIYVEAVASIKRHCHGKLSFLENLVAKLRSPSVDGEPALISNLSTEDRQDAALFVESWFALCSSNSRTLEPPLQDFFGKLGMAQLPTALPESTYSPNRSSFYFPPKVFAVENSDELFIPPSLGSKAAHVAGFVLSGKHRQTDLRALVTEFGSTPTFLLSRANLDLDKRAMICREAPIILIDDDLIAYTALHVNQRLRKLFEVALLTYTTNPYTAEGAAAPPEMFVGRERELRQLREVDTAGVLYGARRLGKSSLLDQIARDANGRAGEIVVYVQVDGAKTQPDFVLYGWRGIYNALVNRNAIPRMKTTSPTALQIQEWIEQELMKDSTVHALYLLIDEADELMGRELQRAHHEVSFVRGLQQLCERVKDKCIVRYVIAGLHNMARMTSEENSPLGKAKQIPLEPFNTDSDIRRGIQLITKPLNALGYFFDKGCEDLPYRIMSVCNFYPAFIQIYCKVLLDSLQNKRGDSSPPTLITDQDLDRIEGNDRLLHDMQYLFGMNLVLDLRYKAIAHILADDYYNDADSSTMRGMTISEIREHCEAFTPVLFQKTSHSAYEALLDEMQKMNMLDKIGARFVLRNQNIAMMLGDRETVTSALSALARETPVDQRSPMERRPIMIRAKSSDQRPSGHFPMPASWVHSNANAADDNLIVLTGNKLSGIAGLATKGQEWELTKSYHFSAMSIPSPRAVGDYLHKERRSMAQDNDGRILAIIPSRWQVDQIGEFAAIASREHAQYAKAIAADRDRGLSTRNGSGGIRLALLAFPDQSYEIAKRIADGRLSLVNQEHGRRWRVDAIPAWSDDALYYHLADNPEVADDIDARSRILQATCGYDIEIEKLCKASLSVDATKTALDSAKRALAPDLETFYHNVGMPEQVLADKELRDRIGEALALIHGSARNSADVTDVLGAYGIDDGMFLFLQWMGLIQPNGNVWSVPSLYLNLIK